MTLALFGGRPIRTKPYPIHNTIGLEEHEAVQRVLDSGVLSNFEGSNNKFFLGGREIKAFEQEWAEFFETKFAVSFNSATSGLMAAVGAAGIGPGDEVILSPWTMTATATAVLVNHAIPVFCDIDKETFCMDPDSLREKITPRTKAVMPVHIYGHPAAMDAIMEIAREHSLIVIEDAAQSPGIAYHGRYTGTIGQMGVFSLNCNKIIQTGEGGIVTTNDDDLAQRLRLIRNHAEAVIATGMQVSSLVNMVGWNYRLNEIEAAIGREQLKKLNSFLKMRTELVEYLSEKLAKYREIILPIIRDGCGHSFYRYAIRIDKMTINIPAHRITEALNAEGMDFDPGYIPINNFPIYQQQVGFGTKGCPFKCPWYEGEVDYSMNSLPNAKDAVEWSFSTEVVRPPLNFEDIDEISNTIDKVLNNITLLQ